MSGRHALRLTPHRMHAVQRLFDAGVEGVSVLFAGDPDLLVEWDLAEFYVDDSRILSARIRLTPYGERVVRTLCNPLGELK